MADNIVQHRVFGVALADGAFDIAVFLPEAANGQYGYDRWDSARRALAIETWDVLDLVTWHDWPWIFHPTVTEGSEN